MVKRLSLTKGAITLLLLGWAVSAQATRTVTYYVTDPQGNVIATTDAIGGVVTTTDYRPYGATELGDTPVIGYGSHVSDDDLIYMQARYFDPSSGRFLSGDPSGIEVGDAFSFNRFVYANGNPVSNADPTGRDCEASPGSTPCSPPPTPPVLPPEPPKPSEASQLASIVVVATVTTSAAGATGGALWSGGLVTLGVGLYAMDGNGFNELVTGNRGCYGDLSCQQPWLQYQKPKKVPVPGLSGKEGAKDVPSWAKGERPYVGESGKEFADRLFKDKLGRPASGTERGAGGDHNGIRKWGDRAFKDP